MLFLEPVYTRITNSSSQQSLSQPQPPPSAVGGSIYGTVAGGSSQGASSQQPSLASQVVAYHFCQVILSCFQIRSISISCSLLCNNTLVNKFVSFLQKQCKKFRIVLFKSLRKCNNGNFTLKSYSNNIMLCGGWGHHYLVFNKISML